MKRILFLFGKDGKPFKIIEDASGMGHYGKEIVVYGYDETIICKLKTKDIIEDAFIDLKDNETIDYTTINSIYDLEDFKHEQWKTEQETIKSIKIKAAQDDLSFFESRHDRLLELITYTEKQLDSVPHFSREWEKLHRKIISLENQLRTVDKKREKAFSIIHS